MIKIFNANDKDFSTAGNIIINPLKCKEFKKKSLNGWYLEIEVPIEYQSYISKDKLCVVKTKSKLRPQAFRIAEQIEYTSRKIKFTAKHVMFDAQDYFLKDVRPTELNGINALNYINGRTDTISPFIMHSNVENIDTAYFIRKSLLEAWSIIEERWNGIFDADNWDIYFLNSIGNDNGETIIYGKNLQALQMYEDWSKVVTKLYPVGYNETVLPEEFLLSDIQYDKPYTKTINFETELDTEYQTEELLVSELRNNAQKYLNENKYPKFSYTIASDINQSLEIGDTVHVKHPIVSMEAHVLEYEYNCISKKVMTITFGNYTRDVKEKFNNIKDSIDKISQSLEKQEIVIKNQTDLINTLNKTGYVYIDDNEILILDKLPKESAKNIWRFGLAGIGFSSNGYEGPFITAITMDGQINADFITTGKMSVDRIEGLRNQLITIVGEIDSNYSELKQNVSDFEFEMQNAGGVNLIKNSTGDNGLSNTTGEVTLEKNLDISNATISKSAIKINTGSITTDEIYINENEDYTYSCLILKNELTNVKVTINSDKTEVYEIECEPNKFQKFSFLINSSVNKVTIKVEADNNYCMISDRMLNKGNTALTWQPYTGEIITKNVKINDEGVGIESSLTNSRFIIDSEEAKVVNKNTEEVQVTFNGDKTILKRVLVEEESTVGKLRSTVLENEDIMLTFDD